MSINICYPYTTNPTGGSLTSTLLLADHLRKEYQPVFAFRSKESAAHKAYQRGFTTKIVDYKTSVDVGYFDGREIVNELFRGFQSLPYIQRIRNFLRTENIDLIHVNDGLTAVLWGIAAKTVNVPVIWHVRSEQENPWDPLRLQIVDKIIFVAESNKRRFNEHLTSKVQSEVIYNGVDLSTFNPGVNSQLHDELEISDQTPIVGFVGNLVERKRPMLFAEAVLRALDNGIDAHIIIAGEDHGGYTEIIKQRSKEVGVGDRMHVLGFRDDIPQVMTSLDLLVLTSSKHGEAFPRVPLEAMAVGTPVLTTNTAGVSEAVIDGVTGRVVSCDVSPDDFAEVLQNTLSSPTKLQIWAENGIERVKTKFSAETYSGNVQDVYQSLVH